MSKKNLLAIILILVALIGLYVKPFGDIGGGSYDVDDPTYVKCLEQESKVPSRIACEAPYVRADDTLIVVYFVTLAGLVGTGSVLLLHSLVKRLIGELKKRR